MTERSWSSVRWQEPVPEQAPDQPVKAEPASGTAFSNTCVLSSNACEQTVPQSIPAGLEPILPLPPSKTLVTAHEWDYLYEPDAETVLTHVIVRYLESIVYQSLLENLASEHAARMVAMKSASDNATKAIDSLTLVYNKARQAAITQEISEIVGGAAAV